MLTSLAEACGDLAQTCGSCLLGRDQVPYGNSLSSSGRAVGGEGSSSGSGQPRTPGNATVDQGLADVGPGLGDTGGLDEDSRSQVEELASVWHAEGRLSMSDFERFWDVLCATESRNGPSEGRGKTPGRAFGLISLGASRASGHRWGSSQWPATTQYVNACLKRQYPQGIWTTLQVQPKGYRGLDENGVDTSTKGPLPSSRAGLSRDCCTWEGSNMFCTAFVICGAQQASPEACEQLKREGFPWEPEEALAGNHSWLKQEGSGSKAREEARIQRQLYLLHSATGHGSTKHMLDALKRRGAPEQVLEMARNFKCAVCQERRHVGSRHVASLEPLPPKWHTVSMDVGHFLHPHNGEHSQFLLILDEGSRFRAARILTKGQKQQPSAATCLNYLKEGWTQYFDNPRTLRVDPAGSFRSQTVESYCDQHGIYLDIIPGEAHWQIGACEQAIKGVKEIMLKLCSEDESLSSEEALSTAVRTFNQRDVIRGFSPVQHALGRNPDETGRIIDATQSVPPEMLIENATGEFERNIHRMALAEKAHADWHARQRLVRAGNSRSRPFYDYEAGELVYFWRTQEAGKKGPKQGRFLGPARVLATERRREADGRLRPGSAVWVVRGRSLLKCCPEQLRRASTREELVENLSTHDKTPWSFTRTAEAIGGTHYEDVSSEVPEHAEWLRAQNPELESPPTRHRITRKRPAPVGENPDEMEVSGPHQNLSGATSSAARPSQDHAPPMSGMAESWWQQVPQAAWAAEATCFWSEESAAVAVEVEMPSSNRGWETALKDLSCYVSGALKRRAVEVSEKRLTPEEKQQFPEAKSVEVRNFIAAQAFEALPEHLKPSRDQAIGMRWVLTWKSKDDGTQKAKARAVLLGYQDPSYEHRSTTAPVMSRQTRQLQLQLTANEGWDLQKGDVTGAFLQGREYPDKLYCIPCDEICKAMGLETGSVTRLRRACYGLVDAPLEWYRTIHEFLESLGFTRLWADPCSWVFRSEGVVKGMISGHVDDFLFSGSSSCKEWKAKIEAIQTRFKWGDWEQGTFTQCGVQISRVPGGFELSQPHYLEGLREIPLNSAGKKDRTAPTSDREKSQLRTLLGGLSWHAQQIAPHVSAEVSLLLSETNSSTVETVVRANLLLHHTKARGQHKMLVQAFSPEEELALFAWVDAASQNRKDGSSTQGILVCMGPKALFEGDVGKLTPVSWHSTKIDRACRSPGAAEAQAAVNGEDVLYYARYQWAEMLYGQVDVRNPDATVRKVPGGLITDSRNVYDKLQTDTVTIRGAEKRSNIEILSVKESQARTMLQVRWVHSEAQLANALTKSGSCRELELFYRMSHQWRIVEDAQMRSARRRKSMGMEPLEVEKPAAAKEFVDPEVFS